MLLFLSDGFAATRKMVDHGQSKSSVINGNGASFQTPNGEAGYYGQDYVDRHTAGNRFTTNDSPGSSGKQKITVKPSLKVNPKKAAKAMMGGLRGGVPGVVTSAVAAAAVAAVQGIIDNSQVQVPSVQPAPVDPDAGTYYWAHNNNHRAASPVGSCSLYAKGRTDIEPFPESVNMLSASVAECVFNKTIPGLSYTHPVQRYGSGCPAGSSYNTSSAQCEITGFGPPSESDWITMEEFAAAQNSDFIRDAVKASCEGSTSPGACYDDLADWGDLTGPASQTGPSVVTTSTTTSPDGTTSTTTSTTNNKYEYNFGPNYYDYSTTTKTVTNTDGVVTETETSDGTGLPGSDPDPEPEPDPDPDYSYSDSEFPEVPSFYEQKYPDGLGGVWNDARAQVDQSAFMQFLQGFIPSFSGSCPAFGLGFNIATWANYGNVQFSSICYVLDFVKIILLITALYTFRAVTFGG